MPRHPRGGTGGVVFHAFNRANARRRLFRNDGDYLAFVAAMTEAFRRVPIRILAWCVMPNHFHLVLWPRDDRELSAFMQRLTQTHAVRWRHAHNTVGDGSLYQGRFKAFPVQHDQHFLVVVRYVERNALRARLVRRAEDWRWGSAWVRTHPDDALAELLSPSPVDLPRNWLVLLNTPQTVAVEDAVRLSLRRSRPFGDDAWQRRTAARFDLVHTLRRPGRPRKSTSHDETRDA